METPTPRIIMDLVKTKLGVDVSYSTALRGKNQDVRDLCGSSEGSYKMMYCYLYMLENVNSCTITTVKLDEKKKFKCLFIVLGASIEEFQVMRKVIIMDATFLKNGYGGVLVFASAQDPHRHNYPIDFGILDDENNESWISFFEMQETVVADSSELAFVSDRNASLIAIANVYPQAHHGYYVCHLSQNVKAHASNVNKDVVAFRFVECSMFYTVVEFNAAYSSFKRRYPSAAKYLDKSILKEKWAKCFFPEERYNLDTSNYVESLNNTLKEAKRYALIPLLDMIVKKLSVWFNEHRKEAVFGTIDNKVVPIVENHMHNLWEDAEKLIVKMLNSFELVYDVTGSDGKPYLVNLMLKSCSCKFFEIEKYHCVHAFAAFIKFKHGPYRGKGMEVHELSSKYYWMELWAMAYYKTIYLVLDMSELDVPDNIKDLHIVPPNKLKKKGSKKTRRFPSVGERKKMTQKGGQDNHSNGYYLD